MPFEKLEELQGGERSRIVRGRVTEARERQRRRFGDGTGVGSNGCMRPGDIRKQCRLDERSVHILRRAVTRLGLSARAHDRVLKVARTIADLDGASSLKARHVAEAVQYRVLDRSRAA